MRRIPIRIWLVIAAALGAMGLLLTYPTLPDETMPTVAVDSYEPMSFAAPDCSYGGEFQSIEAIDRYTVRMALCFADPALPSKIALTALAINDADYLQATGGGGDLLERPVGTGPYRLSEWRRGDGLIYTRFDGYWGEKAMAKTLVLRWSPECSARLSELQAGSADGIDDVCPEDFATVEGDPSLALKKRSALNIFYIGMNNTYPPFDNEHVRQAFAMAIDRQLIIDHFYPPGAIVADQFVPLGIFGHTPEATWYGYDPVKARRILEEEGVLPGFRTTITYRDIARSYLPNVAGVAADVQAQLAELGVTANLVVLGSDEFLDKVDAGEIGGFHLLGWDADYPDATSLLDPHFGPGASRQFGDGFRDIWEALRNGAQRAGARARYPFYIEANELIRRHVPVIPVAHSGSTAAFRGDVKGAYASSFGAERFALMNPGGRDTLVWLQAAEPLSLYCADETDGESWRACAQVMESLLDYEIGSGRVIPALAESWSGSSDLTEWTFKLRQGVKFHNGAELDANDVVLSYVVQWDAAHPLHVGNFGSFDYWAYLFSGFLNAQN